MVWFEEDIGFFFAMDGWMGGWMESSRFRVWCGVVWFSTPVEGG